MSKLFWSDGIRAFGGSMLVRGICAGGVITNKSTVASNEGVWRGLDVA
jgi:hypothetical protein